MGLSECILFDSCRINAIIARKYEIYNGIFEDIGENK